MTRIVSAIFIFVACSVAACGKTSRIPGSPSAIGCSPNVSPQAQTVPQGGGSFHATVSGSCSWSTTSEASWIVVTHGEGADVGTVTYDVRPNAGAERHGRLKIGDVALAVTQAGPSCSYSVQPASVSADARGGAFEVALSTPDGCAWSASSSAAWIKLQRSSGAGPAGVPFTIEPNVTGAPRDAMLRIAGQSVVVSQLAAGAPTDPASPPPVPGPTPPPPPVPAPPAPAPPPPAGPAVVECSYSLSPPSARVAASGGSVTVTVNTAAACAWSPSAPASWITVGAGQRTGSGTVTALVAANDGPARSGRIVAGSGSIEIAQEGAAAPPPPCTFKLAVSRNPVPADGGDFTLDVTTDAHCKWEASSVDEWIGVARTSMGGSGRVSFGVRSNRGDPRSGRIAVGTASITVRQEGCVSDVSPDIQKFGPDAASGKLSVSAPDGCAWSVRAPAWIDGLPASGTGPAAFAFRVQPNGESQRTGTIEIGGLAVQVVQAGS